MAINRYYVGSNSFIQKIKDFIIHPDELIMRIDSGLRVLRL